VNGQILAGVKCSQTRNVSGFLETDPSDWHCALMPWAQNGRNQMMNFGYNSLIGVLILAGDIWAILNIFQSSASNEKKLLWILVVVLLPLLGLILWFFLGPRSGKA
jgi:Phospholipase_D-nuclease N-terminal